MFLADKVRLVRKKRKTRLAEKGNSIYVKQKHKAHHFFIPYTFYPIFSFFVLCRNRIRTLREFLIWTSQNQKGRTQITQILQIFANKSGYFLDFYYTLND